MEQEKKDGAKLQTPFPITHCSLHAPDSTSHNAPALPPSLSTKHLISPHLFPVVTHSSLLYTTFIFSHAVKYLLSFRCVLASSSLYAVVVYAHFFCCSLFSILPLHLWYSVDPWPCLFFEMALRFRLSAILINILTCTYIPIDSVLNTFFFHSNQTQFYLINMIFF